MQEKFKKKEKSMHITQIYYPFNNIFQITYNFIFHLKAVFIVSIKFMVRWCQNKYLKKHYSN